MEIPVPVPVVPQTLIDILGSIGFHGSLRELSPVIFVAVTILSWPIAHALRYINSPKVRLAICSFVGVLSVIIVYGFPTILLFAMFVTLFYIPARYGLVTPSLITFLDICLLGWVHYECMLTGTATDAMSLTGTLMTMAAKISMFGYHMHDGLLIKKGAKTLSSIPHIDAQRKGTAIISPPSYLEYMAYMFDFMGGLVGPLFTFREYFDFINREGDFVKIDTVSLRNQIVKAMTRAFAILGFYLYLDSTGVFTKTALISNFDQVFASLPFHYRLVLLSFALASCRFVYYTVWALTEVTCVISGIAYIPPYHFTRSRNVNLRAVESCTNTNQMTSNWNIRTSDTWLKQCIYQRLEHIPSWIPGRIAKLISRKGLANLLTKVTSAIWHGWYPGYVVSFLSLGLMNMTESVIRQRVHPLISDRILNSRIASVLAWLHTWTSVNIFFGPFIVLTWEGIHTFNSSIYYVFHLYHLALIIGVKLLFSRPRTMGAHPASPSRDVKKSQ
jgi:lysophospholipid acyltransferase